MEPHISPDFLRIQTQTNQLFIQLDNVPLIAISTNAFVFVSHNTAWNFRFRDPRELDPSRALLNRLCRWEWTVYQNPDQLLIAIHHTFVTVLSLEERHLSTCLDGKNIYFEDNLCIPADLNNFIQANKAHRAFILRQNQIPVSVPPTHPQELIADLNFAQGIKQCETIDDEDEINFNELLNPVNDLPAEPPSPVPDIRGMFRVRIPQTQPAAPAVTPGQAPVAHPRPAAAEDPAAKRVRGEVEIEKPLTPEEPSSIPGTAPQSEAESDEDERDNS